MSALLLAILMGLGTVWISMDRPGLWRGRPLFQEKQLGGAAPLPSGLFHGVGLDVVSCYTSLAFDCIKKSKIVSQETADFALPMFCNIHLCGSVISELFLVVTTYYFFFHQLPDVGSLILLAVLVCIIAIGSPGVPGGINMSCSSLVMSIVLATKAPEMGDQFFAVMTAIYTIQDGFGTACNITCDGALTLITETYLKRINN